MVDQDVVVKLESSPPTEIVRMTAEWKIANFKGIRAFITGGNQLRSDWFEHKPSNTKLQLWWRHAANYGYHYIIGLTLADGAPGHEAESRNISFKVYARDKHNRQILLCDMAGFVEKIEAGKPSLGWQFYMWPLAWHLGADGSLDLIVQLQFMPSNLADSEPPTTVAENAGQEAKDTAKSDIAVKMLTTPGEIFHMTAEWKIVNFATIESFATSSNPLLSRWFEHEPSHTKLRLGLHNHDSNRFLFGLELAENIDGSGREKVAVAVKAYFRNKRNWQVLMRDEFDYALQLEAGKPGRAWPFRKWRARWSLLAGNLLVVVHLRFMPTQLADSASLTISSSEPGIKTGLLNDGSRTNDAESKEESTKSPQAATSETQLAKSEMQKLSAETENMVDQDVVVKLESLPSTGIVRMKAEWKIANFKSIRAFMKGRNCLRSDWFQHKPSNTKLHLWLGQATNDRFLYAIGLTLAESAPDRDIESRDVSFKVYIRNKRNQQILVFDKTDSLQEMEAGQPGRGWGFPMWFATWNRCSDGSLDLIVQLQFMPASLADSELLSTANENAAQKPNEVTDSIVAVKMLSTLGEIFHMTVEWKIANFAKVDPSMTSSNPLLSDWFTHEPSNTKLRLGMRQSDDGSNRFLFGLRLAENADGLGNECLAVAIKVYFRNKRKRQVLVLDKFDYALPLEAGKPGNGWPFRKWRARWNLLPDGSLHVIAYLRFMPMPLADSTSLTMAPDEPVIAGGLHKDDCHTNAAESQPKEELANSTVLGADKPLAKSAMQKFLALIFNATTSPELMRSSRNGEQCRRRRFSKLFKERRLCVS